jgi:hypothetical protein
MADSVGCGVNRLRIMSSVRTFIGVIEMPVFGKALQLLGDCPVLFCATSKTEAAGLTKSRDGCRISCSSHRSSCRFDWHGFCGSPRVGEHVLASMSHYVWVMRISSLFQLFLFHMGRDTQLLALISPCHLFLPSHICVHTKGSHVIYNSRFLLS